MADLLPILTKVSIDLQSPSKDFTWVIEQTKACETQVMALRKSIHEDQSGGLYLKKFVTDFKDRYDDSPGARDNPKFPRRTSRKPTVPVDQEDCYSAEGTIFSPWNTCLFQKADMCA